MSEHAHFQLKSEKKSPLKTNLGHIGIDPDANGAAVKIGDTGLPVDVFRFSTTGTHKTSFPKMSLFRAWIIRHIHDVDGITIEAACPRGRDPRGSLFKLARLAGRLEGICRMAADATGRDGNTFVQLVTPQVWQAFTGFASGGDKAYHATRCTEIWPGYDWRGASGQKLSRPTLKHADGYGIAWYGYQTSRLS